MKEREEWGRRRGEKGGEDEGGQCLSSLLREGTEEARDANERRQQHRGEDSFQMFQFVCNFQLEGTWR